MPDFDPDAFAERAAIMEFSGGMSRFRAEASAAAEQGTTRWEALRHEADYLGNPARAGGDSSRHERDAANHMPAVQRRATKESRPLPERDVHAGRGGDVLPSLWMGRRAEV